MRRGSLLTLNCLAHNKPTAIVSLLPTLLPLLYVETAKRPELVHQVTQTNRVLTLNPPDA